MQAVHHCLRFEVKLSDSLVVVLEPRTEGWKKINGCTSKLFDDLQGMLDSVYFGGSSKQYPTLDYLESAPAWLDRHKNRPFLINPIFEHLEKSGHQGMIAVVCTQPPLDLEDWLDTSLLERTVFIRFCGEHLSTCTNEIDGAMGISSVDIQKTFRQQILSITVEAKGLMPLRCEIIGDDKQKMPRLVTCGSEYRITPVKSSMTKHMTIHLEAYSLETPRLKISMDKGDDIYIEGVTDKWFFDVSQEKRPIPAKLVNKFAALKEGKSLPCEACQEDHEPGVWSCPEKRTTILQDIPPKTVILCMGNDYLHLSNWFAFPLVREQKVITSDGTIRSLSNDGKWLQTGTIKNGTRFNDDIWGFYHNDR